MTPGNPEKKLYFNRHHQQIDLVYVPLKVSIAHPPLLKRLISLVKKCHSIADLGCGIGGTLHAFRQANPRALLSGFDYSDVAITKAKKYIGNHHIKYFDLDLERQSLPANKFDLVYCSQVIEHFSEPAKFIQNIARSLTPSGYLFLTTVYKTKNARYLYRNKNHQAVLAPDHINEYTDISDLFNPLKQSGFEILDYHLDLFRFPLMDLALKPLMKFSKSEFLFRLVNHPLFMEIRHRLSVPIFGFYNFQLLARRQPYLFPPLTTTHPSL
ncbi:MAG: class I SAM-dependent methyltransferase [Candidatus Shapirobacteria bacterium]|jgi:SAM-dependent methyltransferase